jgi:tetratricopeptide (TPR) repeat protein
MSRKRAPLCVGVLAFLGCAAATPTLRPIPCPTAAHIAEAMRGPAWGWYEYPGDGTMRGDSARRFAALGMWDVEGGDRDRGLRLIMAARKAGFADSTFILDAVLAFDMMGRPYETLRFADEALARWPRFGWLWAKKASAYRRLGQREEALDANRRADSLAVRE